MRAVRPPAPSPSPYQSPTPSPGAAFQGGLISSPPSPYAAGSPAPAPEPNAVLAFAGARRSGGGGMSPPLIAMLAVVGAALLVVLYARLARRVVRTVRRRWRGWRRRRRLMLITLTGGSGSSPANDSFASFTTYDNFYHTFSPYGLDDAAIKSLPSAQFLKAEAPRASAGARDCAVCLLEFADGDELRALPLCAHTFHADCIDVWLRAHASCPLCRAAIALPAPLASPLRSARRVRPSLDDLLFFHPVPPPALDHAALPEITPASPDRQLNPRDFLLKRSYSFGFERNIATEAASTASPTWRYRLGGGGGDGASGRGRSFWSKRFPSPFGGSAAAAARVFSFRSAAAAKSSPFARRRAAAPAGGASFFMSLGLSSEPPNILVAGRRSNRASSRLRCGDPEALLSPDRLSR